MTAFNFSNRKFNDDQKEAYMKGYHDKMEDVKVMGWENARDKFNLDYPKDAELSPCGYAYACGEIDYLVKSL